MIIHAEFCSVEILTLNYFTKVKKVDNLIVFSNDTDFDVKRRVQKEANSRSLSIQFFGIKESKNVKNALKIEGTFGVTGIFLNCEPFECESFFEQVRVKF